MIHDFILFYATKVKCIKILHRVNRVQLGPQARPASAGPGEKPGRRVWMDRPGQPENPGLPGSTGLKETGEKWDRKDIRGTLGSPVYRVWLEPRAGLAREACLDPMGRLGRTVTLELEVSYLLSYFRLGKVF